MYRLTVEDKENYLLVMRNVFTSKYKIQVKYDLKGSSVDRQATIKEKEKDSPTFKDNDLISEGRSISIGAEAKKEFMDKLTRDVDFLCGLKMMDYSLLIGVHDIEKAGEISNEENNRKDEENSDQDNLSPTEDTEDTDDDQLNRKHYSVHIYFFRICIHFNDVCIFFKVSVPTPPESPSSKYTYGIFGVPSTGKHLSFSIYLEYMPYIFLF